MSLCWCIRMHYLPFTFVHAAFPAFLIIRGDARDTDSYPVLHWLAVSVSQFFFLIFFLFLCVLARPLLVTVTHIQLPITSELRGYTSGVQPVHLCEWNDVIYYLLGIYFEISLNARCENCFHFHCRTVPFSQEWIVVKIFARKRFKSSMALTAVAI